MSAKPVITFRVAIRSDATPDAVHAVLSDPNTHLLWAGEQAPSKAFRLLSMEAPKGATVGTRFSSSGSNSKNGSMTFHDRSVVVEAEPGRRFGFDTESTLERAHAKTWYCHFEHRYTIEPVDNGSEIGYTCRVFPKNYRPWWLRAPLRPITKRMVQSMHAKHMENLSKLATRSRGQR